MATASATPSTRASTNGLKIEETHTAGGSAGVSSAGPTAGLNYTFQHATTREQVANWSRVTLSGGTNLFDDRTKYTVTYEVKLVDPEELEP